MIKAAGDHRDRKDAVNDTAAVMVQKITIVGLAPLPTATGPETTAEGWLIDIAPATGGVVSTIIHQVKSNKPKGDVGLEVSGN